MITQPQWITMLFCCSLTHWGRNKMDAISQTTFWSAFSWMKIFEFPNNISLKFVPKGPINNNPALVQVMACRRPGDKPLSEPMMFRLPTHICVTRPQWVNAYAYFRTPMSRLDQWRGARLQYLQCVSNGRYSSLALRHRDRSLETCTCHISTIRVWNLEPVWCLPVSLKDCKIFWECSISRVKVFFFV